MTDTNNAPGQTFDMSASMQRYYADRQRFEALSASIRPANKKVLFDVLAAADIAQVIVAFDGYGDSGQIEDVSALSGGKNVDLHKGQISLSRASWGTDEVTEHSMTIEEAVEQLAYDFLAETHPGWENNDGAYCGEFTFDVKSRVITLDHNERYTATESYEHTF
ncbi:MULTISPECIES: DUF6878 family protein [Salipiger]|uniref:DUF6878 domain-containing protein n=1 Tax=Salipiger profundus TaxID=1229727 RepID=A0A1U7DDX9_9RHOB|nr:MULTISPECIES: DUF6878 family protein [Salipiger]APX26374.1 hypothetical protein Ga0080559_TMP5037 [Salipiger profundus]GGA28675.1 hypothetical protein GCM10011326_45890 [Salipiger profundus]